MLQRAGISPGHHENAWYWVPLSRIQRTWLNYRAYKEGLTPEEWLRRQVVALLG